MGDGSYFVFWKAPLPVLILYILPFALGSSVIMHKFDDLLD